MLSAFSSSLTSKFIIALPYPPYNPLVGLIHYVGVDGSQVDLCGTQIFVTHTVTDDRDGDVHLLCQTGPCVTGNIGGERERQMSQVPNALECTVTFSDGRQILTAFCAIVAGDDGQ